MEHSWYGAYRKARYVIEPALTAQNNVTPNTVDLKSTRLPFTVRVGEVSEPLDQLLVERSCIQAALITAFNPQSEVYPLKDNQISNRQLVKDIQMMGYSYCCGWSSDDLEQWPREASYLIFDVLIAEAEFLAIKYRQNAFLWLEHRKVVKLHITATT